MDSKLSRMLKKLAFLLEIGDFCASEAQSAEFRSLKGSPRQGESEQNVLTLCAGLGLGWPHTKGSHQAELLGL